jgi:MFS family permease
MAGKIGDASRRPLLNVAGHFYISCLWFAYNVEWGALIPVVLPAQIAELAGARKELANGLIQPLGALVALIVAPLAGALSDYSTNPRGRRRAYIISGVIGNCVFLVLMARTGSTGSIWIFLLFLLGVQFFGNWWGGPYAGLIPDAVPQSDWGRASGWMMLMTAIGTIIGVGVSGQLIAWRGYEWAYGFIIACIVICFTLTMARVHEPAPNPVKRKIEFRKFVSSFWLDPRTHRDFWWVVVTRLLVTMGIFSVFGFIQYFIGDVMHAESPEVAGGLLLATAGILSLPAAVISGKLSDRYGRKSLVKWSGLMMAAACLVYAVVALAPNWPLTIAIAIVFGFGNVAYQAVDWALAIDVLPAMETAGKDMGVWHLALVLPQVIAPAISGITLDTLKPRSIGLAYVAVFAIAALWFAIGSILVSKIRSAR